ncbi:hypothetical protein AS885_08185 [Flavobacterium psychrophilum]|nr:hypothetical protein AS885_08185 [Flavobacterium psychrophilum]
MKTKSKIKIKVTRNIFFLELFPAIRYNLLFFKEKNKRIFTTIWAIIMILGIILPKSFNLISEFQKHITRFFF